MGSFALRLKRWRLAHTQFRLIAMVLSTDAGRSSLSRSNLSADPIRSRWPVIKSRPEVPSKYLHVPEFGGRSRLHVCLRRSHGSRWTVIDAFKLNVSLYSAHVYQDAAAAQHQQQRCVNRRLRSTGICRSTNCRRYGRLRGLIGLSPPFGISMGADLRSKLRGRRTGPLGNAKPCILGNRLICAIAGLYKNLAIANRSRVSCINTNNNTMILKSGLEVTQGH